MLGDYVNIAVLVSGTGTNLQALIDAQLAGKLTSGHIKAVISSNPDAFALERASRYAIQTYVCDKKSFSSQEDFESALTAAIEENSCGLIVLAGFMCILSQDFTRRYDHRIINIHPSLIPSFCGKGFYGLKVHEAALERGVKLTGATVHFVNEIPDGGEIIAQKSVNVLAGDTPQTLQRRVMKQAEWKLLPKAAEIVCKKILNGGI